MGRNRRKTSNRSERGTFLLLPHAVMRHPDFYSLSGSSIKVLLYIAGQYNGRNNGNLSATFTQMKEHEIIASKTTLTRALKQLIERKMIIKTRQGWFLNPGAKCALYAITWQNIDECPNKNLEVGPTIKPVRSFSAKIINLPGTKNDCPQNALCTDNEKSKQINSKMST